MDACRTFCYVEAHGLGPGAVPGQGGGPHPGRVVPRAQVAEAHTAVFVELLARHTLLLLRLRRETQRRTTHQTRARGAESSAQRMRPEPEGRSPPTPTHPPCYYLYTTYILLILLIYYLYYLYITYTTTESSNTNTPALSHFNQSLLLKYYLYYLYYLYTTYTTYILLILLIHYLYTTYPTYTAYILLILLVSFLKYGL